jgi:tripartite-type tricarboxylate transporter receptor subunit TctC
MGKILWSWSAFSGASALLAAATATSPAMAQAGADFFKGKTVTYIAATSPGGGYDAYARLVAEYMQKHLPGSAFVIKNLPGAGHLIGANAIYAANPDGLTIGIFNTGLIYNQMIKNPGVGFDLAKMSWVGKAASDPRVITIGSQSPIKSFEDLAQHKGVINFATGGVGSATYVESVMLANVLNLPVKVLTGYSGDEDQLAVRRGEIAGAVSSRSSWAPFVKNGHGRFIAQIGGSDTDVPQLASLVTDPTAQAIIELIKSQGDIGRLTAGPPGIPQDRLDALRDAYRKALEDKELLAKAQKFQMPIDPLYGEDVAKRIREALDQKSGTMKLIKDALEKKQTASVGAQ